MAEFIAMSSRLDNEAGAEGRGQEQRAGAGGASSPQGERFETKPGDWKCAECGINVFASKSECFRCRAPKPASAAARGDGERDVRATRGTRVEKSSDFDRSGDERPLRQDMNVRDMRKRDLLASGRGLPQSRSSRGRGRGGRGGAKVRDRVTDENESSAERGSAQALWKARMDRKKDAQRKKNMDASIIADIDGGFFQKRVGRAKGK